MNSCEAVFEKQGGPVGFISEPGRVLQDDLRGNREAPGVPVADERFESAGLKFRVAVQQVYPVEFDGP